MKIQRRYSTTGLQTHKRDWYQTSIGRTTGLVKTVMRGNYADYQQYRTPKRKGTIGPDGWKYPTAYAQCINEVSRDDPVHIVSGPYPWDPEVYDIFQVNRRVLSAPYNFSMSVANGFISQNAAMRNKASIEATARLAQGDFNLGVALAESKQTFGFVVDNTLKLVNVIRAIRRGRWSRAGQILGYKNWSDTKGSANKWLEYQYGLMPLIGDIYGAQQTLKEGFKSKAQVLKAVRVISNDQTYTREFSDGSSLVEEKYSVRCQIHARVRNSQLAAAASLGLTNPALIAWELVPFSFVIDWLLPIGDFLEATSAVHGLDFISGCYTWKASRTITTTSDTLITPSGEDHVSVERCTSIERIPFSTWPSTVPLYFKNPFSLTKAVTATALVRQLKS